MGGHHHPQKYKKLKEKKKWISDGLPNQISGFQMEMSKYKKLSVLLWSGLVKIEMV